MRRAFNCSPELATVVQPIEGMAKRASSVCCSLAELQGESAEEDALDQRQPDVSLLLSPPGGNGAFYPESGSDSAHLRPR